MPERAPAHCQRPPESIGYAPWVPSTPARLSPQRVTQPPPATPREDHETMIEALKSDEIVNKVGGRFKLCALIQRRLVQLMEGARPLVPRDGRSDLELVIEEILQDKITLEFDRESFDTSKHQPN